MITLAAALVASLSLGQTFVWTDSKGEEHFTDDRASIPKGVKVRTTEGDEISTVESAPPPGPKNAQPLKGGKAKPGEDPCVQARQRADKLATQLQKAKDQHEIALLRFDGKCAEIRERFGAEEEARCLRRGRRPVSAPQPTYGQLELDANAAAETLRKLQVGGCVP